jgi:tRNA dimethylallyltransferase
VITPPTPPLWVLSGPTASGKTRLGLAAASAAGLEILSMDSMAVYRGMDIGTAKPTAAERAAVPHHLIDVVEPHEMFDTARWCGLAANALTELQASGKRALFVGGTPLYLMTFFKGMLAGPGRDDALRQALEARERAEPGCLHSELAERDRTAAERIHPRDLRRIVRALEFLTLTGRPISGEQNHFDRREWQRPCRIIVVEQPREQLHERVKLRTEAMLDQGLLDETAAIERSGGFSPTSGAAIGYAECRAFLRGRFKDRTELRNRIRRNTHQLIRRQTTWLRRLPDVIRVPPDEPIEALLRRFETPESTDGWR